MGPKFYHGVLSKYPCRRLLLWRQSLDFHSRAGIPQKSPSTGRRGQRQSESGSPCPWTHPPRLSFQHTSSRSRSPRRKRPGCAFALLSGAGCVRSARGTGGKMANAGYVQLRRGILEHLEDGRMTSDEFAAFTVVVLKADHKTGVWRGTGKALARLLQWCERKGRLVLVSLAAKGYLSIARARGHRPLDRLGDPLFRARKPGARMPRLTGTRHGDAGIRPDLGTGVPTGTRINTDKKTPSRRRAAKAAARGGNPRGKTGPRARGERTSPCSPQTPTRVYRIGSARKP
jgi:hypothetical protein